MPTIMEVLGHTQISQTRRYVQGRSHLSKDAIRRMGDTFMPPPDTAPEPQSESVRNRPLRPELRPRTAA
ncbi:hypothetical protein STANM309S_01949 [Streptomyces tanashiensis]